MIRRRGRCLYLAANMLLMAVLFFPWIRERETCSGFFGRMWFEHGVVWCKHVVNFIDWLHGDESHCWETWYDESSMRDQWYDPYD